MEQRSAEGGSLIGMEARSTAVRVARTGIKGASAGWDLVQRPDPGVTILIYHRVGAGTGGQMDLAPEVFDDQLAWLAVNRTVLSLDEAAERIDTGSVPDDGVVLTFDDGTDDWVEHVLPVLDRHGVAATFYVATDFVDRGVPFPGDGRPIDWAGLKDLASSPLVTIGSHTHRHVLLDRLPTEELDDELDRSVDLLRDHLGVDPAHFAYPKAVAGSPSAEAAVRKRFRTAVLAGTRANPGGADLQRLHRSPVQASDSPGWFRRKAVGGMHLEDDLRRFANRVRYRGATR